MWQDPEKVDGTFQDGVPYFSEDEWKPLQEWQKDLYKNVMNEVQQALLSLGPLIINAVFSLRSKENKNLHPLDCNRKCNVNPTCQVGTSNSSDLMNNGKDNYSCKLPKQERITEAEDSTTGCDPDISLHVQVVNDFPCTDSSGLQESEIGNCPSKDCTVKTSIVSVKQEPATVKDNTCKNTECERDSSQKCDQIEEHCFNPGDQEHASADNVSEGNFNQRPSPVENTFPNTRRRKAEIASEKTLTESASVNRPEQMQTGFKLYICSQCGNYFSQPSNVVSQLQPSTCSECEKNACQQGKESKVKRKQSGKGPHKCKDCGKGFITFRSLLVHQRIHTGEKPYACNDCGRCFTVMANLITHQRIHTGEKPFTCGLCEKSFRQLPHLVKHKRMHTGEKPFSCNVCDKRYTDSSALVRHHQVHARENV